LSSGYALAAGTKVARSACVGAWRDTASDTPDAPRSSVNCNIFGMMPARGGEKERKRKNTAVNREEEEIKERKEEKRKRNKTAPQSMQLFDTHQLWTR